MKINKEITISFTPHEVQDILKKYLKDTENIEVESVHFEVGGHEDPDDWQARLPLTYKLDKVICKGIEG